MAAAANKVSNPLSLIAYFAGISESVTIAALPFLANSPKPIPEPLVWFASLFPVLIVVLFFITLNFNHRVLYAPSDFEDQSHFLNILKGKYSTSGMSGDELKKFWKPDGQTINQANADKIREWMNQQDIELSITGFLYSQDEKLVAARKQAATDLGLED